MAAPVIWFASWLFSLMACSGSRCCQLFLGLVGLKLWGLEAGVLKLGSWGFVGLEFWGNKKGPEEAPRTPPEFGMALAIPGGAPGYDEDKHFGNNITHASVRLPKDCANIAARRPMSRDRRRLPRFCQHSGVPAFRRARICNFGDQRRAT